MNEMHWKRSLAPCKEIYKNLVYISLASVIVSFFIWIGFWKECKDIIIPVLELSTVIIGVATFLIIWFQYEGDSEINKILGFGFFAVSIFDFIHIHYYKSAVINDVYYLNLSIKYWIIARLIECVTLVIFSYKPFYKRNNKYIFLIMTSISIILSFYLLKVYQSWFPIFYSEQGISSLKILFDLLIIAITSLALTRLKSNIVKSNLISFTDMFYCVFMMIPCEACFILTKNINSFFLVLAISFKVISYYYLYKGVFISLIKYPYNRLIENNQRLSDILNGIPMPIHTYNSNGRIDFANDSFVELLECSRDKVMGLNHDEILEMFPHIGYEDGDVFSSIETVIDREIINVIRTFLNGNKEEVKALVNVLKIKGGALVLMNEVKQEQEVENLHLQTRTILDSITIPMMISDSKGNITAHNKPFAALIDFDYKDVLGMNIEKLKSVVQIKNMIVHENMNNGDVTGKKVEALIETPRGNKKEIGVTCSVIRNIDKQKVGSVFVMQDITYDKEKQVKLINQEKLALLGQMGATIVHETRNFLTTIKGSSQLIDIYSGDPKIKQYAKKISVNTDEVNAIITDFLNLSKPRETELLEVAFNDLIFSMKGIIETSSLMEGVELMLDLDYDDRYILCDETQIRQVILNICKNAVEAMSDVNKPELNICTGLKESNNEIFIKITDNGKGIPKDVIDRIGTPFFSTKKNGTGLGLNACYKIVKDHNGKIEVESELGKGTTFTIVLPYIEDDSGEIA